MLRLGGKGLRQGDDAPGILKGLRIYGMRFCPFVQRVHLVLHAKNVSYETVNVNLKLKPSWFLERSPGGKVPLLENAEGKFVFESLIICDLLEDLFPTPALYPSDPYGKAQQRIFITRFSEVPAISFKLLKLIMSGEDVNDSLKQLHDHLKVFEDALRDANDTFLGGGTPGMADYMIWPWIERLPSDIAKGVFDGLPKLQTWQAAMMTQPAIKATVNDANMHMEFLKLYLSGDAESCDYKLQ